MALWRDVIAAGRAGEVCDEIVRNRPVPTMLLAVLGAEGPRARVHRNWKEEAMKVEQVEYNDDGDWKFALVTKQGDGGPANYNLLVNVDGGRFEPFKNVPKGDATGHWRDPS